MSTVTVTKEQSNVPTGYTVASVIARISALDVDAAGNAEKAAWKRYLSLCLLSLAKGWDLKKVAEQVFGKGEKPSKSFQNMASMARRVRHNPELLGNHQWADVKVMAIDEAQNATIDMVNRHMAVLGVSSKNEYDKYCDLSSAEAEDKRKEDADAKAKVQADKATAEADVKAKADTAEAEAKANAEAQPERDMVRDTLAGLAGAKGDELAAIFGGVGLKLLDLDRGLLVQIMGDLEQVLANTAKDVTATAIVKAA
jgi:hypothetical protein